MPATDRLIIHQESETGPGDCLGRGCPGTGAGHEYPARGPGINVVVEAANPAAGRGGSVGPLVGNHQSGGVATGAAVAELAANIVGAVLRSKINVC